VSITSRTVELFMEITSDLQDAWRNWIRRDSEPPVTQNISSHVRNCASRNADELIKLSKVFSYYMVDHLLEFNYISI